MSELITPAHLGGHFGITNTDALLLDYLVARYGVRSLIDVGCGPGGILDLCEQRGIEARGIDGDPALPDRRDLIRHDYTTGPLRLEYHRRLGRPQNWHVRPMPATDEPPTIDLCWCVEFVEHVAAAYMPNFLATFRCARVLLLSHAVPGQGGWHHVNEQPPEYWAEVLRGQGWFEVVPASEWVRAHATNQWIKPTGCVWMR